MKHFVKMSMAACLLTGAMAFGGANTAKAQDAPQSTDRLSWTYTQEEEIVPVIVEKIDTIYNPRMVVTNPFRDNWFVLATVGAHTYQNKHKKYGDFGGTITPDFSIGIGKWFAPAYGAKLEYTMSWNRGYTYAGDVYAYGDPIYKNGETYYKMKQKWLDLSLMMMFNLTYLIDGYNGDNSWSQMNQVYLNAGMGWTHYYNCPIKDNRADVRLELQYSRFFKPSKLVSFDIKFRTQLYEANHVEAFNALLGFDLGVTWYIGGSKHQGWKRYAAILVQ